MTPRRLLIVLIAALALAAAPAALAVQKFLIGNSDGAPTTNVCVANIKCTYLNTKNGKPVDVVPATGTLTSWKVRAGSVSGKVRLRVLRPQGDGTYLFAASSETHTIRKIDPEVNKFSSKLPVQAGDVLALTNTTSGIYFRAASAGRGVAYFNFDQDQSDGAIGAPSQSAGVHLLLSATVTAP